MESKQCSDCLQTLPMSEFYRNEGKNDKSARWENICKQCKRQRRKAKKRNKSVEISPPANTHLVLDIEQEELTPGQGAGYFKEYKYPDGRVLRLTKEQFDAVVDVFRMLARQRDKLDKSNSLDRVGFIRTD